MLERWNGARCDTLPAVMAFIIYREMALQPVESTGRPDGFNRRDQRSEYTQRIHDNLFTTSAREWPSWAVSLFRRGRSAAWPSLHLFN